MRVGKKLFPYPVINNSRNMSTYVNSNYTLDYDSLLNEGENFIIHNAKVIVENDKLKELLNNGIVKSVLIVECSATIFRKLYDISIEPKDIVIPIGNLRDKIIISSYIYATQDFSLKDDDFIEDYKGYNFKLEKYDIVAIDDGFKTAVQYDESEDKKVTSMFSIIKKDDIEEDIMSVEKSLNKVYIYMSESALKQYNALKNNDNFKNVFFAIIIVPSLLNVLQELQYSVVVEDRTIDDIKMDYRWFETIENAYEENFGTKLTTELFKKEDILKMSQKLINSASINSIDDIFTNTFKNLVSGGEDDE